MEKEEYKGIVSGVAGEVYGLIGDYLRGERYLTEPHLREIGGSYLEHRGKCLRPALLTFCCQAVGGTAELARPGAAAVEMFHTWTLMHDDVIDHDDIRRGRPTAHVRGAALGARDMSLREDAAREYGVDLAILGGDYLQGAAYDMLMSLTCKPEVTLALARRMCAKLNPELLAGEHLDVRLSQTSWDDIHEEDIMQMMRGKTSALLSFCAEVGVCIGEESLPVQSPLASRMSEFAELCGLAFQMKDDLLGVFGDERKFGKPIGSDIREGKRTVLMLRGMAAANDAERRRLSAILGRADATEQEIADARDIVVNAGADKAVADLSDKYIEQALGILDNSLEDSGFKECLRFWALSLVDRNV